MSEILFNIANIFSKETHDGALGRYDAKRYFIAPYQRGYKWSSDGQNSPVQLLLSDINDAFAENSSEYILQYLTVSTTKYNDEIVLEIIDGQQRLTTLTILISVLINRLSNTHEQFTNHLLSYKVRPVVSTFLDEFIYTNISQILNVSWEDFTSKYTQYDEQDIYYLFHAAKKINELLPEESKLENFLTYIKDNVKLILNHVENTPSCEKIFANLNTNKVDLTGAELIKALFLTKAAREKTDKERKLKFKEVLETRVSIGRQWDEIDSWCNIPNIKSFFFKNSNDPIQELLEFLAIRYDYVSTPVKDNRYELFNFFQSKIKRGTSATIFFNELRELKSVLNEWFQDNNIYNVLGYLIFAKGLNFNIKNIINFIRKSKSELNIILSLEFIKGLPERLKDLEYGINNDEIHRVLLALSVFSKDQRFDYHSFQREVWSLEHIFPQTPEKFPKVLYTPDIQLIKSLIGMKLKTPIIWDGNMEDKNRESMRLSLNIKLEKTQCELISEEILFICDLMKSSLLNNIGNMALLTGPDNSSNSNGTFNKKRLNIVDRISNGSFVPKHTYDVFSKLLSKSMNPDLSVWTDTDIGAHYDWIENRFNTKFLNKQ